MTKSNRLGAALAAVSLAAIATACAGPGSSGTRSASFKGKVDPSNVGLATRAQLALASNDLTTAISLAESAVERTPQNAEFRALLGNCYLAAGRFASAEAAYRDSLTLQSSQPQVVLKLALMQIARGGSDEARGLLSAAQSILDPADVGLALALAGDPQTAVAVLEPVAHARGADSRVRQNLALAYAFAGNWDQARTIAAQDVPADQLDARIQQWMSLATPGRASDQVAAFIGVQPAVGDPGQPVRLALNKGDASRQAAAEPAPAPEAPPAELSSVATVELPPVPDEVPVAIPASQPVAMQDSAPVELAAAPVSDIREARPALSPAAVRLSEPVAPAKARAGKSRAVVQLGAYSSRASVSGAWSKVAGKYRTLKSYTPVTARFAGAKGTVYRLAVKGFASDREAINLCASLKRAGGSCFVRSVSGDAPVQFASR